MLDNIRTIITRLGGKTSMETRSPTTALPWPKLAKQIQNFFLWMCGDSLITHCTRKTTVNLLMNYTARVLAVYYALMQCSQAVCRFISCCWRRLPSEFNTTLELIVYSNNNFIADLQTCQLLSFSSY